ncbi:MAG: kinase-like protein [uncultured bacterium]|nr:MAG: kinase-like protein [uncultured bacterium]
MNNKPFLIVVSGFSGTGKTTISNSLSSKIPSVLLSVDEIEKKLRFNTIMEAEKLKYPCTLKIANNLLKDKTNVILDGNFRFFKTRKKIIDAYHRLGFHYFLIHCDCPEYKAEKRIQLRHKLHPGYYKKTASYRYSRELFDPIKEHPFLKLNTDKPIENSVQEIIQYIQN